MGTHNSLLGPYFSSFSTPSKFSLPWLALKALRAFRFTGGDYSRRSASYRRSSGIEGAR